MSEAIRGERVDAFLEHCREEDRGLYAHLGRLDGEGRLELAGILGRFAWSGAVDLEPVERLFVYRVLDRIRKPAPETLTIANKILDYLDVDVNSSFDEDEMKLAVREVSQGLKDPHGFLARFRQVMGRRA
jgi:hypothetical protein